MRKAVVAGLFCIPLFSASVWAQWPSLAPPKTVWDSDLDGTALHRISTMPCPVQSGAFRRNNIQLYDKAGFDVGCDYQAPGSEITLYLTRIDPAAFDAHFDQAKQAMEQRNASRVAREPSLPAPPGYDWRRASLELPDIHRITDVMMAPFHGWYFEVRVTYAPDQADATAAALGALADGVLKTAGAHLAACEALAVAPHAGKRITDEKSLMTMALMTGALMGKIETKGTQPPAPPPVAPLSCGAGSFSIDTRPFVYWHDRSAQGVADDRITGIAEDFTATTRDVLAVPDMPGLQSGHVAVVVDRGDHWDIAAFFDGPPAREDMAKAALLNPPAASVSKEGKNITFFMPSKADAPVPPDAK